MTQHLQPEERAELALLHARAQTAAAEAEIARLGFERRCKDLLERYQAKSIDTETGEIIPLLPPLPPDELAAEKEAARARFLELHGRDPEN